MPSLRRVLVPALVGLLALGELGAGAAAAVDQRADQARARRVAAQHRAEAAYLRSLQPLVVRVFDAVQPVQDAADAWNAASAGSYRVLMDVLDHAKPAEEVRAVAAAVRSLPVPRTLPTTGTGLADKLDALAEAVGALRVAPKAGASLDARFAALDGATVDLELSEQDWAAALVVLDRAGRWPYPNPSRGMAAGRDVATRGGFVVASDLACAKLGVAIAALPDRSAVDTVLHRFPKQAALIRSSVAVLRKVRAPESERALARTLDVQLQAVSQSTSALDLLSGALRRHDMTAYRAALPRLARFDRALEQAHGTYSRMGAGICAEVFQGDDVSPSTPHPLRA